MLAKPNRLTAQADFTELYERGAKQKFGAVVFYSLGDGANVTRIGFVVSKKVSKLATRRNYLKRLMRVAGAEAVATRPAGIKAIALLTRDLTSDANRQIKESFRQWAEQLA